MSTPPKHGAAHCHALDAWLRGEVAAPKRGEPIIETLRFTLVERFGKRAIRASVLLATGEIADPGLALVWQTAWRIVHGYANSRLRQVAEEVARVQLVELYAHVWGRLDGLDGATLLAEDLGDDEILAVVEEWRLLAGIVALCLWEAGDARARRDVRDLVAEWIANGRADQLHPNFVRVLVGLARADVETWRPGQGALGALTRALEDGQHVLSAAVVPHVVLEDARLTEAMREQLAAARLRDLAAQQPEPEPEPAPPVGLSLTVFPSLDHLPGRKKDDTSGVRSYTSQSPLTEHGYLARKALPLSPSPDLAAFVAELDREFPWYAQVTRTLASDLGRGRFARIRHTLLHGRPGSAKTRYARRVLELAGLPVLVYPAAGTSDAAFGGTSRQWSTGRLSVPAGLIARVQRANVGLVLDELDKLPPPGVGGQNGRLDEVLLGFLEPESARAVHDLYVEAPLDLSAVSYLATANDLSRVPGPLKDRFRILEAPLPRPEDLPAIARSMQGEIMSEQGLDPAWTEPLAQDELDLLAERWRGGSLRGLRRMIEVLLDGRPAGRMQ